MVIGYITHFCLKAVLLLLLSQNICTHTYNKIESTISTNQPQDTRFYMHQGQALQSVLKTLQIKDSILTLFYL